MFEQMAMLRHLRTAKAKPLAANAVINFKFQ
jgi:hypothetical protein